jgi:hypothetical protein
VHCASCGVLIPCRLTDDGKEYVAEAITGHLDELLGGTETIWTWAQTYRDEVFPLLDERQQARAEAWLAEPIDSRMSLSNPDYLTAIPQDLRHAVWIAYEADPDDVGAYRPGMPTQAIYITIGGALEEQFDVRVKNAWSIGDILAEFLAKADLNGETWEVAVVEDGMDVAKWNGGPSVGV